MPTYILVYIFLMLDRIGLMQWSQNAQQWWDTLCVTQNCWWSAGLVVEWIALYSSSRRPGLPHNALLSADLADGWMTMKSLASAIEKALLRRMWSTYFMKDVRPSSRLKYLILIRKFAELHHRFSIEQICGWMKMDILTRTKTRK